MPSIKIFLLEKIDVGNMSISVYIAMLRAVLSGSEVLRLLSLSDNYVVTNNIRKLRSRIGYCPKSIHIK